MLQDLAFLRRIIRASVRRCLYPLYCVVLAALAVVVFPAAALWVRWERWRTRRQLLRVVNGRGVKR